ncbi:hypothetical protein BaRGS_00008108 [Batillaria attramentaria]|uniref:Anaphase-promoting complex subunit 10 n=1 Tax=Batillaria attramentaria TaxID=370345 RepID=A0ABD0LMV5_9CAEN
MATKLSGSQDIDIFRDERDGRLREVGNQAVWSLSSCKPGFGVDQLRDESNDTYWQSDGPQPHLVNIQFHRKTTVHDVCIYADYKSDESYTPNRISIRVGNHANDLCEIEQIELSEPSGWVCVPLRDTNERPFRTFMLQLAVLSNHQNGRDTHIRRIKVRSPAQSSDVGSGRLPVFTSREFQQFAHVR